MESGYFWYIVLAIVGVIFVIAKVIGRIQYNRRSRAIRLAEVDQMPGLAFERYVARLYQHRGYRTKVGEGSHDLGVDVVAINGRERLAIRVKRHSKSVGRRAVSDAVAAKTHCGCTGAAVVTNSYFSRGAKLLARRTHCRLVDRNMLADWIIDFQRPGQPTKPTAWSFDDIGSDAGPITHSNVD